MQTNLSKWFEKKYLEWQLQNGKANISEFANYIDLSQSYVSQVLNGTRSTIGMKSAVKVAEKLNDYSVLSILGYSKQESVNVDSLSVDLRSRLKSALLEIRNTVNEKSLDPESPEAKTISEEVLKKHGFIVNSNE